MLLLFGAAGRWDRKLCVGKEGERGGIRDAAGKVLVAVNTVLVGVVWS